MTRHLTLALFMGLAACGTPPAPDPSASPPADAAATWNGGHVAFADLESAVAEARTTTCREARRGGGSVDALVPCYREVAEGLALEQLVLAELPDVERAIEDLGEKYQDLRRHAYLEEHTLRVRDGVEVSDAEVEAHFEENRESYKRPGQLMLWNIFRRHEDPAKGEAATAFLAELKERFLAGETFSELAREYSHSETRLRGGQVGRVNAERLPERLRGIAFSLAPGDVSDPVLVRGGAVLLHVTDVVEASEFSLQEIRQRVRRQLEGRRVQETLTARVADRAPPPGSTVLSPEELLAALDGADDERVVLDIGGQSLTARQMRNLAGLGASDQAADLGEEGRDQLLGVYERQKNRQLLLLDLLENAEPELREIAEEHLRREAVAAVADEKIRGEMDVLVDADPEKLRDYFDDNRLHYQSPLEFKLHIWTLPFGADPPGQQARMVKLHDKLVPGEIALAAAAEQLGGSVNDAGWTEFDNLRTLMPNKAQSFVLQLGASGYSVPYQQDDALHVIWLEERREPRQLEYDEAAEQVREDYLKRFEQDFFRQVAEGRLADAGFVFSEDAVRAQLSWPAGAPATELADP